MLPAVYRLANAVLDGGWRVVGPLGWEISEDGTEVIREPHGSGGNFSAGYRVIGPGGREAFLKAIDLSRALTAENVLESLKDMIDTATFERRLHRICADRNMDRVVMAVGEGDHVLGPNLQDRVPFIILELADGDVRRRQRQISQANRAAWAMRALHHAAVGLNQLHQADISHQDLKPSNLMSFSDRSLFKVGDMGRSLMLGATIQHENYYVAGDPTYAPLELLYGYVSPDWDTRRLGCDLYLLGSMAVFFFLGHGLTPLVLSRLDGQHVPADLGGGWEGSYEDVLPIIRSAFTSVLGELHEALPERLREPVVAAVRALCEPDPLLRGHPRTRAQINSNRFELTRFISEFNYLATQAQIDARGTLA